MVPAADGVDLLSVKTHKYRHTKAFFVASPQSDFKSRCCEMCAKPPSKEGDDHCPDSADGGGSLSGPRPPELRPCRL
jgi:hypothetical protein